MNVSRIILTAILVCSFGISNAQYYQDKDNDGYGTGTAHFVPPSDGFNYVNQDGDCNDNNSAINPGRPENFDGIDNNCAGGIDEGFAIPVPSAPTITQLCGLTRLTRGNSPYSFVTWHWQSSPNGTNTSTGPANNSTIEFKEFSSGSVYYLRARHTFTGQWSTARTINYSITQPTTWYADNDGDTYGDPLDTKSACDQPLGYVSNNDDYDDTTTNITNISPQRYYSDGDGDGFGNPAISDLYSVQPADYVSNDDDLDDTTANITNIPPQRYYSDGDGDGFGNPAVSDLYSVQPADYVSNGDDLDDTTANITNIPPQHYYGDADGDGFGDPAVSVLYSVQPDGYVDNNLDACPNEAGMYNGCTTQPCINVASALSTSENYVFTITPRDSVTSTVGMTQCDDAIMNVMYFDGLGRPKQSIGIGASPLRRDMVTHIGYDSIGRQDKDYLPVPIIGVGGGYQVPIESLTKTYYHTEYQNDFIGQTPSEVNPYSQKLFEASPLNRVLKQAAPGKSWAMGNAHEIGFSYQTNAALDQVRQFAVGLNFANNTYTPSLIFLQDNQSADIEFYSSGELNKTITYDENHTNGKNHSTEEFTDKQGRVVLKRTYANMDLNQDGDTNDAGETEVEHDTYYVYDDFGNLTYVLPPKMEASTATLANLNTQMNELGYQYVYDHRNRLVEKRIPGKGWEYIVYNKLDQPILTQDANQRAIGEWLFTKYDAFGRVAYTGKASATANMARTLVQNEVDGLTTDLWVKRQEQINFGSANILYDNGAYPTGTTQQVQLTEILTINYYDDYKFNEVPSVSAFYLTSTDMTQGLATGSRVKVLDVGEDKWITTATYYDDKARPIYIHSENEYLGTEDVVENKLDFVGQVLQSRMQHSRNGDTVATLDNFTYDHQGRLLKQTQCIGDATLGYTCNMGAIPADLSLQGNTITTDQTASNSITISPVTTLNGTLTLSIQGNFGEQLIAENHYDELGQLVSKNVGGIADAATPLQTVDYEYNVRGWLKTINDPNNLLDDLFAFGINYNDPNHGGTALYNGNIAETEWRTSNTDNSLKHYRYAYDALNRITSATDNTGKFNLTDVTYDKMGNIETLKRQGWTSANPSLANNTGLGTMDDLTYSYLPNSNKLMKVADAATLDQYGFRDDAVNTAADTSDDYTYDPNGNMISDANKEISSITYNHLNLPTRINVNTDNIQYIYDATGVKLKKTVGSSVTEYAGNHIYQNGSLQFFNQLEGYVTPNGSGGYDYVYQYKDHLGNVRLSYLDNNGTTEIVEENNYYPFGLKHKGYNMGGATSLGNDVAQRWKYNGKELDEDLGLNLYHYGFRLYDPVLGRFPSIDPISDQFPHVSTYNYAENEPVGSIDLWGLQRVKVNGKNLNTEISGTQRTIHEGQQYLKNPKRTKSVGKQKFGSKNITSVVGRTARHAGENGNFSTEERNAFRHALFSATLTEKFGKEVSTDILNAHEGLSPKNASNADVVELIPDESFSGDESGADQTADLFNNEVGQVIGEKNQGADNTVLAVESLLTFFNDGLFVAGKDKEGNWKVEKQKITQEQFNNALQSIYN